MLNFFRLSLIIAFVTFASHTTFAQNDYNAVSNAASESYKAKDYAKAEAGFKQALELAVKNYGTSSVQYRDTRWWQFFVYGDTDNVKEAFAAIKDAAKISTVLRDEYEVRVIEDAERYADRLKQASKFQEAISLYRLAAKTREQRNWLQDASYYKDLRGIMHIRPELGKLDSMQYYFDKVATAMPQGSRDLGAHLSEWATITISQNGTEYYGKIEKSCEDYLRFKEQKNEKDPGYAEAWLAFGKIQNIKGQYERALKSYSDARAVLNKDEQQVIYYRSLALSAVSYNEFKKYDPTAQVIFTEFEEWTDRYAEYLGNQYLDNMIEIVHYANNRKDYPHAEKVLLKILPTTEKQFGKNSSEYKMVAMTLSNAYEMQGKTELAKSIKPQFSSGDEKQVIKSMGLDKTEEDIDLLAKAVKGGRFAEAVTIFERSFNMLKKHYESKGDYEGLLSLNTAIATSYQQIGDYYKAGQVLLNSKKIADEHLEKTSDMYINVLMALGDYYSATGAYGEADETYYAGMQILDKARTSENQQENDAQYYTLAERMAALFTKQRYFRDAENLYIKVLNYHEEVYGKNSLRYQFTSTALADVYQQMGYFVLAQSMYDEAMPILKKELGEQTLNYVDLTRTLANINLLQGNYTASEAPYLKAKAFYQSALGVKSDRYMGVVADLGLLYSYTGQWDKAEPLYHEKVTAHLERVRNLFPLLSEKEKTDFYAATRGQFNTYNVFAMNRVKTNPQEAGEMYNLQLVSKSLLFRASNRVRASVLNSKDENLKALYSKWRDSREQLSKVYQLSDQQKKTLGLDEKQLEKNINELERELTLKSELFARLLNDNSDWKAIKAVLKPGEAAVEIVRIVEALPEYTFDYIGKGLSIDTFNAEGYAQVNNLSVKCPAVKAGLKIGEIILSINGQSTQGKTVDNIYEMLNSASTKMVVRKKNSKVTYTTEIKDDTVFYRSYPKKIRYVALAVTPDAQTPKYVTILNGDELETKYAKYYRNMMQIKEEDFNSYNVFWKPLKSILGNATRVYFSPDGVYNSINPSTLYNPETKRYVLDDTELVLVSNTADILRPVVPSISNKAVLIGFPDYNLTATSTTNNQPSEFMLLKQDSAQRFMSGNKITDLPGTRTEVNAIESLLKPKLEVTKYMSGEATEEKIKSIQAPRLLHIATHGFFLDKLSVAEGDERGVTGMASATLNANPLLRSGLLLAGSGKTISEGRQNNQAEDGVLTAYEALNLDLNQTDMVVLSACETGLGQIQTGEGVYGLQRAFRAAGAQSVLMSLWKVDDTATQQLMTGFYSEWLSKGKKQTAFREAQLKLRKQFSHPYYWGAFVMMGQ